MICPVCQQTNSARSRFCIECGAALLASATTGYRVQSNPLMYDPATVAAAIPQSQQAPYGYIVVPAPGPVNGAGMNSVPPPPPQPQMYNNVTIGQTPQMVNNVTVATSGSRGTRRLAAPVSRAAMILGAMWFVGSGIVAGAIWDASARSYSPDGSMGYLALVATLLALIVDYFILDRFFRR